MKAIGLFQFYLPYLLPRGPDWDGQGVSADLPPYSVKVRARGNQEELFPNDVDKTLSGLELVLDRISLAQGRLRRVVSDIAIDRIEARVQLDLSTLADLTNPTTQDASRDIAIQLTNLFLHHCRVAADAPFLQGIVEHYRVQDGRKYVINPHSASWFDAETGIGLPVYDGRVNASCSSGAVPAPETGAVSLATVIASLQSSPEPDLASSLLVDARERLYTLRLRESLLLMGTACEVASTEYQRRVRCGEDPRVKKLLKVRNTSFAERHFHLVPQLISSRSLKLEGADVFALVERAYKCRNNVAHDGRAVEDGGVAKEIELPVATQFLIAIYDAVRWISEL